MANFGIRDRDQHELLAIEAGRLGFKRLAPGESAASSDSPTGGFAFVRAMGGDVTFGAGTTVAAGDAPVGDTLPNTMRLEAPLTAVENAGASAGALYCYFG